MHRRALTLLFAVSVLAIAGAAAAAGATRAGTARITVKPAQGGPHTRFEVSFRAPDGTGSFGSAGRRYVLSAAASQAAAGCVSDVSRSLPDTRAHAAVHVALNPRGPGSRWCPASFSGQIEEIEAPVCARGRVCPAFVVLLGTVGSFSFRVRAPGGDRTPPVFAGLKGAFACTPGAQRPGQRTPFTLSWKPAHDNRTPSSKLVYEIYESTVSGGERFAVPTWTTRPGVTSFRTPGLPAHGRFYFVVRARDQAGNQDRNRVQRLGIDPCV